MSYNGDSTTNDQLKNILTSLGEKIAGLPLTERIPLASDLYRLRTLLESNEHPLEKRSQSPYQQASEILESITDAFYAMDASWHLTFVNQAAARLFHRSSESLIGMLLWDVFPYYQRSESYPIVQYAMNERTPVHYETFSMTLNTWVEAHAYPSPDGGLAVYLRDITDRKVAEAQRRESEAKFQAIFKNAPFAVILTRLQDETIIDVNPAWLNMFEFSKEEVIGRTILELNIVPDSKTRAKGMEEIRRKGWLRNFEMTHRTKSNQQIVVAYNSDRIRINEVDYLLSTMENITERKLAEEKMRESEHKFSLIFQKAPFAATLSKVPDGVLVDVNEAWVRMFGYSRQDALGKTLSELSINPDEETRVYIMDLLRSGKSAPDLEMALPTKSGERRVFLVSVNLIKMNGEAYLLNTAQDITELNR